MGGWEYSCPGGIIGAILADGVKRGEEKNPEIIAKVEAWQKEWDEAGIRPGKMATYLADGRLVEVGSPEHQAEQAEFMSRFRPINQ